MKYRIIKYGLLTIIGFFAIYQISPVKFGDYCTGLGPLILFARLGNLFLLVFLVFLAIDLILKIKHKIKFDYIPCIFLGVFIIISFLLFRIKIDEKFWTKTVLTGRVMLGEDLFSAEQLILYENKTFFIKQQHPIGICIYQGKYFIQQDTLVLKRKKLPEPIDKLFCTKYLINQTDSFLIPIEKEYGIINFSECNKGLLEIAN